MSVKTLVSLFCLIGIIYIADAQFLEVAQIAGKGAYYVYKAVINGKAFYDKLKPPPLEINGTYAYLSLKENLDQIKEKLTSLGKDIPEITNLKSRMFELQKAVARVDDQYKNYVEYSDPEKSHNQPTILKFAEQMLDEDVGLPATILDIHTNLVGLDKNSLVNIMETYSEDLNPFCSSERSRQQYFYSLYLTTLATEFKVHTTMDYALNITSAAEKVDPETQRNHYNEKALTRITNVIDVFREVFKNVQRELWRCDPNKHVKNVSFIKLKNLYRWIFYGDGDFKEKYSISCSGECPTINRNEALKAKCHDRNQCSIPQRVCSNIIECTKLPFKEDYEVCAEKNINRGRRYKFVRFMDHGFWHQAANFVGMDDCDGNFRSVETFSQGGNYNYEVCSSCKCICDETTNSDRYFSLKYATSDITSNKVVTGIKFVKEDHTIFIQIQQGEMLPGAFISKNVEWKSIEDNQIADETSKYDKREKILKKYRKKVDKKSNSAPSDKFELNWFDQRAIYLDDIELPKDEVVTGARFIVDETEQDSFLQFDIRSTKFDVESGQLLPETSYWYSTDSTAPQRTKLNLGGYDTPTAVSEANRPDGEVHLFTYFTPSSLTSNDAGQNTLPFIDIQPVVSNPPAALSGISLVIKKGEKSGGYLIFKTKSYNVLWL